VSESVALREFKLLLLAEEEHGFIADHQLQQGNPPDAPQLVGAVERVAQVTGRVAATSSAHLGCGGGLK
jgi:IS5 family transposase